MVDNQHRLIPGYRDLTEEEIQLISDIKMKAEEVGQLVKELFELADSDNWNLDKRWLSIGRTDLQQGFMALTRGVAQPNFF